MNAEWFKKNKVLLIVAVVLAGFLGYAWKNDFSFSRIIKDRNYTPGQVQPPPQQPPQTPPPTQPDQPWTPPAPKVSEQQWRSQFEREREQ